MVLTLRIGGMRFLVSFIDCVRSLMTESGLVDIMSYAFRGVDHNVDMNEINFHRISVH